MPDFNKVLTPGDYQNGLVNTVVEIPKGSSMKIEWDRQRAAFVLDRVEPTIFAKPVNYGFIPQTIDEDGDELDTLVVTDESIPTGVWLSAKIIGLLNFEDDGAMDYKVVVVPADDRNTGDRVASLNDLGERWQQQVDITLPTTRILKNQAVPKLWAGAMLRRLRKLLPNRLSVTTKPTLVLKTVD